MTAFEIVNHGSIVTFTPLTPEAQEWWDDNVDPDCQTLGPAYCVEARYADVLIDAVCSL